jgi:hypothetical protein
VLLRNTRVLLFYELLKNNPRLPERHHHKTVHPSRKSSHIMTCFESFPDTTGVEQMFVEEDIKDEDMEEESEIEDEESEIEEDEGSEIEEDKPNPEKQTKSPRSAIASKKKIVTKKAVTKKAVTKKAVTKKAVVKKTVAKKNVTKATKIKKPRTIRRPYKSMPQVKLTAKHAVTNSRVEVLQKRITSLHNQLERYNAEVEHRLNNPEEAIAEVASRGGTPEVITLADTPEVVTPEGYPRVVTAVVG